MECSQLLLRKELFHSPCDGPIAPGPLLSRKWRQYNLSWAEASRRSS